MRRRGQREGHVYRRGNSWFGQFRVDTTELDERGRFKRKTLTKYLAPAAGPGKVLKKRAKLILQEEHLRDLHKSGPLAAKTVREFVEESFLPQARLRCKRSGKAHYEYLLSRHVLPMLGDLAMRDVKPQHVYALLSAKLQWRDEESKKGLSVQTLHHIRNAVVQLFKHAKRMQAYAGDLPTDGVRLPRLEHAERKALSWAQVEKLAAAIGYPDPEEKRPKNAPKIDSPRAVAKQAADNVQLGALVRVLALTGLRIGEALGLRWRDVDLERGVLRVRETFSRGQYDTLKTRGSSREVPLHSMAIAELRKLVPDVGLSQAGGLSGSPSTTAARLDVPVFAGRKSGRPLDQHNIAGRFLKTAGKLAGVPAVSWHVLRHTAATLVHEVGLSVEERQKVLGHSAAAMTGRYTHPELGAVREKMERIGRVN